MSAQGRSQARIRPEVRSTEGSPISGAIRTIAHGSIVALILFCGPAAAQSIYKCKDEAGRTTYSTLACQGERPATPLPPMTAAAASQAPASDAPAVARAPLPKQCDNGASLQFVVARLASPATPDDIRGFLADERFRLVRCEYVRLTAEEWRERDLALREVESRDPQRRKAAMARVVALYDRYLTPVERAARARTQAR